MFNANRGPDTPVRAYKSFAELYALRQIAFRAGYLGCTIGAAFFPRNRTYVIAATADLAFVSFNAFRARRRRSWPSPAD